MAVNQSRRDKSSTEINRLTAGAEFRLQDPCPAAAIANHQRMDLEQAVRLCEGRIEGRQACIAPDPIVVGESGHGRYLSWVV